MDPPSWSEGSWRRCGIKKKVQFVILRDESGSVQLVNPALRAEDEDAAAEPERRALTDSISALTGGTFVLVEGI